MHHPCKYGEDRTLSNNLDMGPATKILTRSGRWCWGCSISSPPTSPRWAKKLVNSKTYSCIVENCFKKGLLCFYSSIIPCQIKKYLTFNVRDTQIQCLQIFHCFLNAYMDRLQDFLGIFFHPSTIIKHNINEHFSAATEEMVVISGNSGMGVLNSS